MIEWCVDELIFGLLDKCFMCGGVMEYVCMYYKCLGFILLWFKCNYILKEVIWKSEFWKLFKGLKNKELEELVWMDLKKRLERKVEDVEKFFIGMYIILFG